MKLFSLYFFLPFMIYLGIAIQGVSFYLACVIVPIYLSLRYRVLFNPIILKICLCFFAIFSIIPVINIASYFFSNNNPKLTHIYQLKNAFPEILQLGFPTALFFSSTILLISSYFINKKIKNYNNNTLQEPIEPLKAFLTGLLPASILFCLFLVYQYYSGIEFRSTAKYGNFLTEDNMLKNGRFRVYGLYGHPLTIASVGLAYSTFAWSLLWMRAVIGKNSTLHFLPFQNHKFLTYLALAIITIANSIAVYLSAGRTATVINGVMIAIIPVLFAIKKKPLIAIGIGGILSLTSVWFMNKQGVLQRIEDFTTAAIQDNRFDQGNNRPFFWKVYAQMIKDKPYFGHGSYWIKKGVRTEYYNQMGYENLKEKFNAHNNYLEILAAVGILGFIWIGCFFTYFLYLFRKILNQNGSRRFVFIPILLAFAMNFLHSLTQNVFFDSSVFYIYITIIMITLWDVQFNRVKTISK